MLSVYRLIHISDMHFGDRFDYVSSCLPGLGTHDPAAAKALSTQIEMALIQSPYPTGVVATGDLTTWGTIPAFDLAFEFLRNRVSVGGIPYGIGFKDMPVVPGNHDRWDGKLSGIPLPGQNPLFESYFHPPVPGLYSPPGHEFPYRLRLYSGPIVIYLYGLDSTQITPLPGATLHSTLANGYITPQQLSDLATLVASEPEPASTPRLRIAAIHHPLAYPGGRNAAIKKLTNRRQVIGELQRLGFAIALGGHQHKGFTAPVRIDRKRPRIEVFSVGTCTQAQCHFTTQFPFYQPTAGTQNEYRTYEFRVDRRVTSNVEVKVTSHCYDPNQQAFAQAKSQQIPFDLTLYK